MKTSIVRGPLIGSGFSWDVVFTEGPYTVKISTLDHSAANVVDYVLHRNCERLTILHSDEREREAYWLRRAKAAERRCHDARAIYAQYNESKMTPEEAIEAIQRIIFIVPYSERYEAVSKPLSDAIKRRDDEEEKRSIATEQMWKERQGDEYGSY